MRTRPDAFAAVLSADGTRLLASRAVGGLLADGAPVVATRDGDEIWVAGVSWSGDFPQRRAVQPSLRGGRDAFVVRLDAHVDSDGDTLPTAWELQFGLDPDSPVVDDGAAGDPDHDGRTNAEEHQAGTHPRGLFTRYFAEGATSGFFETRLALLPTAAEADVLLRFETGDGATYSYSIVLDGLTRGTLDVKDVEGLATAEFSTIIESDQALVADRTMSWDVAGYGSHAETSVTTPSTTWYLAEGATHSGFELFYLLQNPGDVDARVEIRYLLPGGAPLVRSHTVNARSRFTVWVDMADPALASTDVSAIVSSDHPVIVERAMYLSTPGSMLAAGHASAGTTSLSPEWFFAEGATGPFFDMFLLVANPTGADAPIEVRYLLPDGSEIVRSHQVPAQSRYTVWVDREDSRLADTAVSAIVTSTAGVPIVAERSMWWPGPTAATWAEAHNSVGLTSTGRTWALAEGEVRGLRGTETYILIANRGPEGTARVTLYYEDGTSESRDFTLPGSSRTNVAVGFEFPGAVGKRFAAIVEALEADTHIIVERAMYSDANGVVWAAGTNAVATKLQ
jgi:hypothetical protein